MCAALPICTPCRRRARTAAPPRDLRLDQLEAAEAEAGEGDATNYVAVVHRLRFFVLEQHLSLLMLAAAQSPQQGSQGHYLALPLVCLLWHQCTLLAAAAAVCTSSGILGI